MSSNDERRNQVMKDQEERDRKDLDDQVSGAWGCSPKFVMAMFAIVLFLAIGMWGISLLLDDDSDPLEGGSPTASANSSAGGDRADPSPASSPVPSVTPSVSVGCSIAVTLPNPVVEVIGNGFTQFDVRLGTQSAETLAFRITGEPTVEAIQLVTAAPDAGRLPNEWDVTLDRVDDRPFPLGIHELTLEVSIGDEVCTVPLLLEVLPYS